MLRTRIQRCDFSFEKEFGMINGLRTAKNGAVASFVGYVRRERGLYGLFYEYNPVLARLILKKIALQAVKKFGVDGVVIIHRVGLLKPGEKVILVVSASSHRKEVFAAVQWIVEKVKSTVPLWKREIKKGVRGYKGQHDRYRK